MVSFVDARDAHVRHADILSKAWKVSSLQRSNWTPCVRRAEVPPVSVDLLCQSLSVLPLSNSKCSTLLPVVCRAGPRRARLHGGYL